MRHRQEPVFSLGRSPCPHTEFRHFGHAAICSRTVRYNGLQPHNSCSFMDYSFTDPGGIAGWVGHACPNELIVLYGLTVVWNFQHWRSGNVCEAAIEWNFVNWEQSKVWPKDELSEGSYFWWRDKMSHAYFLYSVLAFFALCCFARQLQLNHLAPRK